MEYSIYELLFFLFCYAFLGWCIEVAFLAVRTGKFCNRGVLNLPLCLSYGLAIDLLLVIVPTLQGRWLLQLIAYMVITSACAQVASEVSVRLTGKQLWDQEKRSVYSGHLMGLVFALILSGIALVVILLIHPMVFLLSQMIPKLVLKIVTQVLLLMVLVDFVTVYYTAKRKPLSDSMQDFSQGLQEGKTTVGTRLAALIWKRLKKAYPKLEAAEESQQKYVFAQGLCLDKIIWVFIIAALGGDIIETFYVRLTAGIWMSRSSLIYGTFSIVWGFGAALLTLLLRNLADKEDRYIFLGGFFLGGTYEYMCSVLSEVLFGTVFWDYSDMPFNIGGRTNLLFCIFWGILSLVWVKICYPRLSRLIEKIPPLTGKILTWILVVLLICDMLISALAMIRYVERKDGISAENAVEQFVDHEYPDELVEFVWPNMKIQK